MSGVSQHKRGKFKETNVETWLFLILSETSSFLINDKIRSIQYGLFSSFNDSLWNDFDISTKNSVGISNSMNKLEMYNWLIYKMIKRYFSYVSNIWLYKSNMNIFVWFNFKVLNHDIRNFHTKNDVKMALDFQMLPCVSSKVSFFTR